MVEISSDVSSRIVAVAERVFLASGFNRVTMDELARELGMSKKTLYAHFESKEALLRAMLERRVEVVERALDGVISGDGEFPAKMRKLVHVLQEKMGRVSPQFLDDIRRFAPECFSIIEQARARIIPEQFRRLLEQGMRDGYLRTDVNPAVVTRLLLVMIQNMVRPDVAHEMRMHPVALVDAVLKILFQGILTEKGHRSCGEIFE